jgi:hypothetical protein
VLGPHGIGKRRFESRHLHNSRVRPGRRLLG